MGSRAGYTLLTGLFIGIAGMCGLIGFFVDAIPKAVLSPILIFVGLDIMSQAFLACPARHATAVAFAFLPTVARMLVIKLNVTQQQYTALLSESGKTLPELLVTIALGNGFILTGMLWGAFLVKMIDRHLRAAGFYLVLCALLTFFGIIHSAKPDGDMYLPWHLTGMARHIPFQFTVGYLILAALMFALSYTRGAREPVPARIGH
jgi:AGZA family xanthine/uracil permease-like MFS transporter